MLTVATLAHERDSSIQYRKRFGRSAVAFDDSHFCCGDAELSRNEFNNATVRHIAFRFFTDAHFKVIARDFLHLFILSARPRADFDMHVQLFTELHFDLFKQGLHRDIALDDVVKCFLLNCLIDGLLVGYVGQDHHFYVFTPLILSYLSYHHHAGHFAGQKQIRDDEVGAFGQCEAYTILAIHSFEYGIARAAEHIRENIEHFHLVLYDEYLLRHAGIISPPILLGTKK